MSDSIKSENADSEAVNVKRVVSQPERACVLRLKLSGNTRKDIVNALLNLATDIDRGKVSKGVWGSPSDGAIYEYLESATPTKDDYFLQLDEYLKQVKNVG